MKVEVFDDWKSVLHSVVGGLSYFFPILAVIFVTYQIVERFIKHENLEHTVGDILEFGFGYMVVGVCTSLGEWVMRYGG
jgi:hypothetical protein